MDTGASQASHGTGEQMVQVLSEAFPRLDVAVVHAVVHECHERMDEATSVLEQLSEAAEMDLLARDRHDEPWDADEILARKVAAGQEEMKSSTPTLAEVIRKNESEKSKGCELRNPSTAVQVDPGTTLCPCHGKKVRKYWPVWNLVHKGFKQERMKKRRPRSSERTLIQERRFNDIFLEGEAKRALAKVDDETKEFLLEIFQDIGRQTILDVLVYYQGDIGKATERLFSITLEGLEGEHMDHISAQEDELNILAEQFEFVEAVEQLLPHVMYDDIISALKQFDFDTKQAFAFLEKEIKNEDASAEKLEVPCNFESEELQEHAHHGRGQNTGWTHTDARIKKVESIKAKFPSCDEELVHETLDACNGNFRMACSRLENAGFLLGDKDSCEIKMEQDTGTSLKRDTYQQYNMLPLQYFRNYCALMESSRRVGSQGHKRKAKELEVKALMYRDLSRNTRREAASHIYKHSNMGKVIEIDLHGLHVQEAIDTLGEELHLFMKSKTVIGARVVTGKGNGSGKAGPKLRPAVHDFLHKRGYHFYLDKSNDGCTVVEFKNKGRK